MPRKYKKEPNWTVPKTFAEFYERYPTWHRKWLTKRYAWTNSDWEDVAQELLAEALRKQSVEKYDASKRGKAPSAALFFNWMGTCFLNSLRQMNAKKHTQANKTMETAMALPDVAKRLYGTDHMDVGDNDDPLAMLSQKYGRKTQQEGDRAHNLLLIKELRDYMTKHRPDLLPVLDQMERGETADSYDLVRFRAVVQAMLKGKKPKKLRKPYRTRKKIADAKKKE